MAVRWLRAARLRRSSQKFMRPRFRSFRHNSPLACRAAAGEDGEEGESDIASRQHEGDSE
jgi:predicted pyridoxine 5'-phosphate oxidase superfamily flavin-nucleotide-binding protein